MICELNSSGVSTCPQCKRRVLSQPGQEIVAICGGNAGVCKHRQGKTGRIHLIEAGGQAVHETEYVCDHDKTTGRCVPNISNDATDVCRFCSYFEDKKTEPLSQARKMDCVHLGKPTGEQVEVTGCGGCKTSVGMTAVFGCVVHGECTPLGRAKDKPGLYACPCDDHKTS